MATICREPTNLAAMRSIPTDTPAGKRIMDVIRKSGLKESPFARYIGISPSTIYQIKTGRQGITLRIAELINEKYPEYTIEWLMSGHKTPFKGMLYASDTVVIPMYNCLYQSDFSKLPSFIQPNYLTISSTLAGCASCGVFADCSQPGFEKRIYLLRKKRADEPLLAGRMYLFQRAGKRFLGILRDNTDAEYICIDQSSFGGSAYMRIPAERIKCLYIIYSIIDYTPSEHEPLALINESSNP